MTGSNFSDSSSLTSLSSPVEQRTKVGTIIHTSPRKKQKQQHTPISGVETARRVVPKTKSPVSPRKFGSAQVSPSLDGCDDSDDSMPEVGSVLWRKATPSPKKTRRAPRLAEKKTRKRKRRDSSASDNAGFRRERQAMWSPPPADELLSIPGELIFAQEKASSLYWPAKVLGYIPPKNKQQQPRYSVEYLDTTQKDIPRSWFLTSEEAEFATCELGKWESEFKEVQDDDDNDDDDASTFRRSPSPIPSDPPPDSQLFIKLNIREQFVYTKPVLSAILHNQYHPARSRHEDFMNGGSKRKNLAANAGLRGRMDPREVAVLHQCLIEWCLRDEKKAGAVVDTGHGDENDPVSCGIDKTEDTLNIASKLDHCRSASPTDTIQLGPEDLPPESSFITEVPEPPPLSTTSEAPNSVDLGDTVEDHNTPPPRQRGCDAYENNLSGVEKVDYCTSVLLSEAISQILLWRTGRRQTTEILPEDEEMALYNEGQALLKESDWVNDVLRLREAARRNSGLSTNGVFTDGWKGSNGEVIYSNSGRPKRGIRAPKTYAE